MVSAMDEPHASIYIRGTRWSYPPIFGLVTASMTRLLVDLEVAYSCPLSSDGAHGDFLLRSRGNTHSLYHRITVVVHSCYVR